jgi:hypothetical protein
VATVPSQRDWSAGEVVTAAMLNANVRDAMNFVLARPDAMLRQTVAQSLPHATWTDIAWDVEDLDSDSGHSTTSNTSRYTAVTAGWYLVGGVVNISNSSTGVRATRLAVNGNPVLGSQVMVPPTVLNTAVPVVSRLVFLNVGDFITVEAFQSSGSAVSTTITAEAQSCFTAHWVRS